MLILSLGDFETELRSIGETDKFSFAPIGFVSERIYSSIAKRGERCAYTCEILEKNGQKLYKVTCQDNNLVISRAASSTCWVEIKKMSSKINGKFDAAETMSGPV